ncbi:hypothetical protein RchiOBHm_Chr7g0193721 [Rosa chinensis]|uniref:Uncharacterized protein n=1 Tax=Rosa chinensis TaxID=74649 RepID=A0A2P6P5W4_ROSCH|nr:hypothetical protein RchiOBHm_Chr7g0193721 [Rosa chinensis]
MSHGEVRSFPLSMALLPLLGATMVVVAVLFCHGEDDAPAAGSYLLLGWLGFDSGLGFVGI